MHSCSLLSDRLRGVRDLWVATSRVSTAGASGAAHAVRLLTSATARLPADTRVAGIALFIARGIALATTLGTRRGFVVRPLVGLTAMGPTGVGLGKTESRPSWKLGAISRLRNGSPVLGGGAGCLVPPFDLALIRRPLSEIAVRTPGSTVANDVKCAIVDSGMTCLAETRQVLRVRAGDPDRNRMSPALDHVCRPMTSTEELDASVGLKLALYPSIRLEEIVFVDGAQRSRVRR